MITNHDYIHDHESRLNPDHDPVAICLQFISKELDNKRTRNMKMVQDVKGKLPVYQGTDDRPFGAGVPPRASTRAPCVPWSPMATCCVCTTRASWDGGRQATI